VCVVSNVDDHGQRSAVWAAGNVPLTSGFGVASEQAAGEQLADERTRTAVLLITSDLIYELGTFMDVDTDYQSRVSMRNTRY
jgi:hypothetical protein